MSKEFDKFKMALTARSEEISAASRLKEDIKRRESEEREKYRQEYEKRIAENKKRFEEAGIIDLFQEIIDSKIVIMCPPRYKTFREFKKRLFLGDIDLGLKTVMESDYCPACISWEHDNKTIKLDFNSWEDQFENLRCESIEIRLLENGRFGINEGVIKDGKPEWHIREIEDNSDIPMYVGRELAKYSRPKNNDAL